MPTLYLGEYRIEVDDQGYLSGIVFEGALGFVAQIFPHYRQHSGAEKEPPRALKLPRLLADTDQENHYVCTLTDLEIRMARLLVGKPGLTSLDNTGQSLLQTLSRGDGLDKAVMVQFSKEMKPRFCQVAANVERKELSLLPDLEDVKSWLTFDLWYEALNLSRGGATDLESAVIVRKPDPSTSVKTGVSLLANHQAGHNDGGSSHYTWYVGLPSPVYFWQSGTLEHAVRKGQRGSWTWRDHCKLAEQLAKGLFSLYGRRFVHGDLRPANVMYHDAPADPANYALIDYASYGLADALGDPNPKGNANHTLVGVAVAEARQSSFYPLERKVGRERENCDTVLIRIAGDLWLAHVGYRSDMYGDSPDKLSDETQSQLNALLEKGSGESDSKEWKVGDRIRIRDFVFELKAWKSGPTGFSMLSHRGWLVHNNRILVPLLPTAFEGKDRVLSVSRIFPIWQWSMATDFFSLGVMLLYSLFYASTSEDEHERTTDKLEREFDSMITVMSSPLYAGVVLPNIAGLARLLGSIWTDEEFRDTNQFRPENVAKLKLVEKTEETRLEGSPGQREFAAGADLEDNRVLRGRCWSIAMSIVQTTPGAQRILNAVNRNLPIFVCMIDLAMELMHRRDDLPSGTQMWRTWICADRTTAPNPNTMGELIKYIERMQEGLGRRFADVTIFECPESKVLPYSSKSEPLLRIQMQGLEGKIVEWKTRYEEANIARMAEQQASKKQLDTMTTRARELREDVGKLTEQLNIAKKVMTDATWKSREIKEFLKRR